MAGAALLFFGVIHINHPELTGKNVRGVDVSAYQGEIDWDILASQGIDFAYIKATEGSGYVDPQFAANWEHAASTGLRIGAYHFFSFETPGATQAANFCDTVTAVDGMLPPVIDVEYYGNFGGPETIDIEAVRAQLSDMVDILTDEYGKKPVLYVSEATYETIVSGRFDGCPIWYRSVYAPVPGDVDWTFWQFSNRHRLRGYNGEERYIDMNVFIGDADEFASFER